MTMKQTIRKPLLCQLGLHAWLVTQVKVHSPFRWNGKLFFAVEDTVDYKRCQRCGERKP